MKMKRWSRILLISSLLLILISGCDTSRKPPKLSLMHGDEEYEAILGTYSWIFPGGGVEADADGPLGWKNIITTIEQAPQTGELTLHFEKAPDTYQVRCWNDDHWDDYEAYAVNNYIEITDDTIPLYNDDGYIYEVFAAWKGKGDAYYGFYVTPPEKTASTSVQ